MALHMVNTGWFRNFMKSVDVKYVCPSNYKVRKMILSMYKSKKELLQQELERVNCLSITLDMWSDRRMRSYMGITAHFLQGNMQQKSFLLDFTEFENSHTDHCMIVLDNHGIRHKVCYIITDNAANMIAAFRDSTGVFGIICDNEDSYLPIEEENNDSSLAETENKPSDSATVDDDSNSINDNIEEEIMPCNEYETAVSVLSRNISSLVRLPCGIHTLQLVVLDGLKVAKFLSEVLSKCSRLATILHTSGKFSTEYFLHFKTTIPKTTQTRWNSVFLQLQAISKLEPTILDNLLRRTKHNECLLTSCQMKVMKEAVDILEHAYDATLIMEEENTTMSLIALTVFALHTKWRNMRDDVLYAKLLLNGLLESLENRFGGILNIGTPMQFRVEPLSNGFEYQVYILAAALDPEFPLDWVDEVTKHKYKGDYVK